MTRRFTWPFSPADATRWSQIHSDSMIYLRTLLSDVLETYNKAGAPKISSFVRRHSQLQRSLLATVESVSLILRLILWVSHHYCAFRLLFRKAKCTLKKLCRFSTTRNWTCWNLVRPPTPSSVPLPLHCSFNLPILKLIAWIWTSILLWLIFKKFLWI